MRHKKWLQRMESYLAFLGIVNSGLSLRTPERRRARDRSLRAILPFEVYLNRGNRLRAEANRRRDERFERRNGDQYPAAAAAGLNGWKSAVAEIATDRCDRQPRSQDELLRRQILSLVGENRIDV